MKAKIKVLGTILLFCLICTAVMTLAQQVEMVTPNWNIPDGICPTEGFCRRFIDITPDLTMYFLSTITKQLAVIPPDGSSAQIYNLEPELGYNQRLDPALAVFDHILFMFRFNGLGNKIDILRLDRATGTVALWTVPVAMPFVTCNPGSSVEERPFFVLDSQRGVFCSESPDNIFSVYIVNITSNTIEQTLALGRAEPEVGRVRPWAQMRVGLDENIYFTPFASNFSIWGIDPPSNIQDYQVKYDVFTQDFSLSEVFLPEPRVDSFGGVLAIDAEGNKYIAYRGGTVGNRSTELHKISPDGELLWSMFNPPLPDNPAIIYLLGEDEIAAWDASDNSTPIIATTTVPLSAPSDLVAEAVSTSQINLTWMDNATDESAYSVEWSLDGGTNWETPIALSVDSTSSLSDKVCRITTNEA